MAYCLCPERSIGTYLSCVLVLRRPPALLAQSRKQTEKVGLAKPLGDAILGLDLSLRTSCYCRRSDSDDFPSLFQPRTRRFSGRLRQAAMDAPRFLGYWIFLLGLGRR